MPDEPEKLPIPDEEWSGKNLGDMLPGLDIDTYSVAEWTPEPDGSGDPQQVHLRFHIKDLPYDFAIRFKTTRELDRMLSVLSRARENVWGPS